MRLYEITYNGRKWETTNEEEAVGFYLFMIRGKRWFGKLLLTTAPYEGEKIPNIQVA